MTGTLIATLLLVCNSEQQFFDKEPYINPFVITHFFGGFKHGGMTSTRIVVTEAIDNAWREVEVVEMCVWDVRVGGRETKVQVLQLSHARDPSALRARNNSRDIHLFPVSAPYLRSPLQS